MENTRGLSLFTPLGDVVGQTGNHKSSQAWHDHRISCAALGSSV